MAPTQPNRKRNENEISKLHDTRKRTKHRLKIKKTSPPSKIKIPNLTLADIKRGANGKFAGKSELFRIPSKNTRAEIYKEAANAISNREQLALPTHGHRWWKCEVKITEKDSSNAPLFRWFRGALELACLPHIFEEIEVLNKDANRYSYEGDFLLENRKPSPTSLLSIEFIPNIQRVWISPNNDVFRSRKRAQEHAIELGKKEELIERVIFGRGLKARLLKPFQPTKKQQIGAGLSRFIRDGLWVSGQDLSWQAERAEELVEKADHSKSIDSFVATKKTKSKKFKLEAEQISLLYEACLSHYERVMNTVQARALHHELADGGFDVLRERGRGRYDLTIPLFDSNSHFEFLTSPYAFWMSMVKLALGSDNVVLVHKGCFLSLPGAEAQVYHQDGVHLNTKVQKPCHAVNVFIPLVDLTVKNGATEFCLGSHMLGYENFVKENCVTPLVFAGTPIMFDYRLGHRGMGNNELEPRPILYLTYSTGSKKFVDTVNFSKKRWQKIGDLVERPLSREERIRRRHTRTEECEQN